MDEYCAFEDVTPHRIGVLTKDSKSFHHNLYVPHFEAGTIDFGSWERRRFESMEALLKKGDVLIDVGVETGWMSVIFASFVGPENMILVEPMPDYWPNIRWTWEVNQLADPKACYAALAGTDFKHSLFLPDVMSTMDEVWPGVAWDDKLLTRRAYRYLHDTKHRLITPQITIDQITRDKGPCQAITIDVEGAELAVLYGAFQTLREHKPKVWCSVHPDLLKRNYQHDFAEMQRYMTSLGYSCHYLCTDHEEHHVFLPAEAE